MNLVCSEKRPPCSEKSCYNAAFDSSQIKNKETWVKSELKTNGIREVVGSFVGVAIILNPQFVTIRILKREIVFDLTN